MKTVLGIITDKEHAEMAIDELQATGYDPKDISIVMKDKKQGEQLVDDTGVDMANGAVTGATSGALLGGLAGLLASIAIPGLGAFFIGGPIAAALGLTGAAASTASGAATGALAGGILGALTGLGLSDEEAKLYEERINTGGILIAVPARNDEEAEVEEILTRHKAQDVKSISVKDDRFENRTNRSKHSEDEEYVDYQPTSHTFAGVKGGKTTRRTKGTADDVTIAEEE